VSSTKGIGPLLALHVPEEAHGLLAHAPDREDVGVIPGDGESPPAGLSRLALQHRHDALDLLFKRGPSSARNSTRFTPCVGPSGSSGKKSFTVSHTGSSRASASTFPSSVSLDAASIDMIVRASRSAASNVA
jgi:hypothetical protein